MVLFKSTCLCEFQSLARKIGLINFIGEIPCKSSSRTNPVDYTRSSNQEVTEV